MFLNLFRLIAIYLEELFQTYYQMHLNLLFKVM